MDSTIVDDGTRPKWRVHSQSFPSPYRATLIHHARASMWKRTESHDARGSGHRVDEGIHYLLVFFVVLVQGWTTPENFDRVSRKDSRVDAAHFPRVETTVYFSVVFLERWLETLVFVVSMDCHLDETSRVVFWCPLQ